MEQAISHILSSHFYSIPKAYGKANLPIYLDYRIHSQNGICLRSLIIQARDLNTKDNTDVTIKLEEYDFSFFDQKRIGLNQVEKHFNAEVIYPF